MSTHLPKPPEQPDNFPVDTNTPNLALPCHFTCSQKFKSLSALSISAALDYMQAPIPDLKEELGMEVACL